MLYNFFSSRQILFSLFALLFRQLNWVVWDSYFCVIWREPVSGVYHKLNPKRAKELIWIIIHPLNCIAIFCSGSIGVLPCVIFYSLSCRGLHKCRQCPTVIPHLIIQFYNQSRQSSKLIRPCINRNFFCKPCSIFSPPKCISC